MLLHKSVLVTLVTCLKIMTYSSSKLITWKWSESTVSQNVRYYEQSGWKKVQRGYNYVYLKSITWQN